MTVTIKSRDNKYSKTLQYLTVSIISDCTPSETIARETIQIPKNIKLADPEFYKPAPIDLLLGAGPTLSLFCHAQYDLSPRGNTDLIIKKTLLGWVIAGNPPEPKNEHPQQSFTLSTNFDLSKFWEIEEGPEEKRLSPEEIAAEDHFCKHISRDSTRRYTVALPFKIDPQAIGESKEQAIKRFHSLERKLNKLPELKQQYHAVIQEYLDLGHMSIATDTNSSGFYLPHHAVIKEGSLTTKVRVVFDGSAKSTSGISLNEALMVGPTIQDDIFSLLLRFRCHRYVLTGDIEKMYRQFNINKNDRKYQRIIWRDEHSELTTYELNTVTFGLSAAPFLAIRCLQQLAKDHSEQYPLAAKILLRDLYVDDLITGCDSLEEALQIRTEVTELLTQGRLNLRQWASNEPSLLNNLKPEDINQKLQLTDDKTIKTLGIHWNSKPDTIAYTVNNIMNSQMITKRTILANIATIFDPLGLLGPVILMAKTIIQQLWAAKIDWDESVPCTIHTKWVDLCSQLPQLSQATFKRNILIPSATSIELHGFCDASETGYGACIYVKSTNSLNQSQVSLLCSKSRVAPLKTTSIPRLELCGAHALASLYDSIKQALLIPIEKTILWTDSSITLQWIQTQPHLLKTFVANRVVDIQSKTNNCPWQHVRSEDNPADALSRGQQPADFLTNSLWKHGPKWLSQPENTWKKHLILLPQENLELKKITCFKSFIEVLPINKFNSLRQLRRVISYCFRFIDALKHRINSRKDQLPTNTIKNNIIPRPLQTTELNATLLRIIRHVQQSHFRAEIQSIMRETRKDAPRASKLIALNPFIDKDGLVRVGGRLQHSNLTFNQKHPIILPKNHHLVDLIIQYTHLTHLHAGIQATLYAVRQQYWPLDGRNQVRRNIRKCLPCCRANPPPTNYIMGNLPSARITGSIGPFTNVGVDYCGPFHIKEKKHRNRGTVKVYVAVFICLAVKAVHLELVSDMTTDGFLAALDRFIARRGKPNQIHSHNGSNFVGANNELKKIMTSLQSTTSDEKISKHLHDQGIQWKFTPPLSPHFGGIWEAAVKTFKHHLVRVVGNQLFTFEELNSLIIRIEAVVNSRPLTPMSSDPNDLQPLTPGHFLNGAALTSTVEYDLTNEKLNTLSRWQLIQRARQDFWNRWHKEYLNELNIRKKWTTGDHNIKIGSLVLLKEDHIAPMKWKLGRIKDIHPGEDGIIRVVTIKTANGEIKRNIKRVAPLPATEPPNHTIS